MKALVKTCFVTALVFAVAAAASAADPAKGGKKAKGAKRPAAGGAMFRVPKQITLSAEQKEEMKNLRERFGKKMADLQAKATLTDEQKAAQKEARKQAAADGKKGKELRQAVEGALNLTEEQSSARGQVAGLRKQIQDSIRDILTEEQRAALGKGKGNAKKPKAGKKKKEA
jgi:Spy/CpxP family protein refolding chaperone